MRIKIIATCAGLVAMSSISAQAAPLPQPRPAQPNSSWWPKGADTAIGALSGKMSGAIGTGAVASRRRGGIYLASDFRVKPARPGTAQTRASPARVGQYSAFVSAPRPPIGEGRRWKREKRVEKAGSCRVKRPQIIECLHAAMDPRFCVFRGGEARGWPRKLRHHFAHHKVSPPSTIIV